MDFLDTRSRGFLLGIAGLMAVLIVGYYLIRALRRRMVEADEPMPDLLDTFRDARDAGEMEDEEYQRVQELLRGGTVVPRPTVPGPSQAPSPTNVESPSEAPSPPQA